MSRTNHLFPTYHGNYDQETVTTYTPSRYHASRTSETPWNSTYSTHHGTSASRTSSAPAASNHGRSTDKDYDYKHLISREIEDKMGLPSTRTQYSTQLYGEGIHTSDFGGNYPKSTQGSNWSDAKSKTYTFRSIYEMPEANVPQSVDTSRADSDAKHPEYNRGKSSSGWERNYTSKQHAPENVSPKVDDVIKTYSPKADSRQVRDTPKSKERQIDVLEGKKQKLEDEINQLTLLGQQLEVEARSKSTSSYDAQVSTPSKVSTSTAKEKVNLKGMISQLDEAIDDYFMKCEKEKEALRKATERMSKVDHYGTTSEYQKLKGNFEEVHAELEKLKSLYNILEEKSLQSSQKLREEMEQYKKENAELSERLSAEMNVKVSSDETSVENVSIKNRPMTVAEEYRNLCSNQWMEAKGAMDEVLNRTSTRYSEEKRANYLCNILMNAEAIAKRKQQSTIQDAWQTLQQVLKFGKSKPDTHIPPSLNNAIGDLLRLSCEEQNFVTEIRELENILIKIDKEIYTATHYYPDCTSMIKDFIKASLQLTWKMVIQRPIMKFDVSQIGYGYDESKQEIAWGSDDPRYGTTVVQRYVAPTLCHGDQVMVKGKVMLKYVGRTAGIPAYHEESYA